MGGAADYEAILPFTLVEFLPVGLLGLTLAGLLAAYLVFCARLWSALPGAQITSTNGLAVVGLILACGLTIIAAWPRSSSRRT